MSGNKVQHRTSQVLGWGLVGLGILFLILKTVAVNPWRVFWPFFVIAPGLMFFLGMALGGKELGALAIPGSLVTMAGLLLLYQSVTGHWESWAYAWALLFPISVGLGFILWGRWSEDANTVKTGNGFFKAGMVIFLTGLVFFELILDISGLRHGLAGQFVLPLLLIGLGIYLLVVRSVKPGAGIAVWSGAEPPVDETAKRG